MRGIAPIGTGDDRLLTDWQSRALAERGGTRAGRQSGAEALRLRRRSRRPLAVTRAASPQGMSADDGDDDSRACDEQRAFRPCRTPPRRQPADELNRADAAEDRRPRQEHPAEKPCDDEQWFGARAHESDRITNAQHEGGEAREGERGRRSCCPGVGPGHLHAVSVSACRCRSDAIAAGFDGASAPRRVGADLSPRDRAPGGREPVPSCRKPFRVVRLHMTATVLLPVVGGLVMMRRRSCTREARCGCRPSGSRQGQVPFSPDDLRMP
jgi:hypothetical protein